MYLEYHTVETPAKTAGLLARSGPGAESMLRHFFRKLLALNRRDPPATPDILVFDLPYVVGGAPLDHYEAHLEQYAKLVAEARTANPLMVPVFVSPHVGAWHYKHKVGALPGRQGTAVLAPCDTGRPLPGCPTNALSDEHFRSDRISFGTYVMRDHRV